MYNPNKESNDLNNLSDEQHNSEKEKKNKVNVKKFCLNWKNKFILKNQKNVIKLTLKNLTKTAWKKNSVSLVCDPKRSNIEPENIAIPKTNVSEGKEGDFYVFFPISEKKDYVCVLYLLIDEVINFEYEIILNISFL